MKQVLFMSCSALNCRTKSKRQYEPFINALSIDFMTELTRASLNSEKVSMIIPKTMLRPMVVIKIKTVISKKKR